MPGRRNKTSAELRQALAWLLGRGIGSAGTPDPAPAYDPSMQDPFDYVQPLLSWGAPAGASTAGWVTGESGGRPAVVDLSALHAAGCFPERWQVPLSAAAVRAANAAAAREAQAGAAPQPSASPGLPAGEAQQRPSRATHRESGPTDDATCGTGSPHAAVPAPVLAPAAEGGRAQRSWGEDGGGWWRRSLNRTACGSSTSQHLTMSCE